MEQLQIGDPVLVRWDVSGDAMVGKIHAVENGGRQIFINFGG